MEEYSYPSGDAAAFTEEMNEKLAPIIKIVEIEGMCPTFKVEGTEAISDILIKGSTFEEIVRQVAGKYFRAEAMFKANTFWFFAQV